MKDFLTFIVSCILGACPAGDAPNDKNAVPGELSSIQTRAGENGEEFIIQNYAPKSLSGDYLASQFAQRHHDWGNALKFMDPLLEATPDDTQLINKAMVLAMGSGETETAIALAHKLLGIEGEQENSLALLFVALEHFKNKDYQTALSFIEAMPEGSLSDFILPLLESWAQAALGKHDTQNLGGNTIHIHHAILIAAYLGETDNIEGLLQQSLGASGLSLQDLERIADSYAYIGKTEIALELYTKLFEEWPENRPLAHKIDSLKNGEAISYIEGVDSPEEGVASALYDTARLLFQEQSDESARVFAHMALYLNPDLPDAQLLLGYITARNNQLEEAIHYYQAVQPDDEKYEESRRMAADLLESAQHIDDAISELDDLVKNYGDLEALIQIGDIHRRSENFDKAVSTYNKAAQKLGSTIPREYWQLYYVRGMSYERLGEWDKAEADLTTALEYQPENPLILNYLGYAWADQGVHLQKSLELIRKAAALRPTDGYIIDSLGWVLYRMGQYPEAVPHLEKAVELLPYDPVINDHLGDAYWQVGRKLEARFQWVRAQNHSEDEDFVKDVQAKLDDGLSENHDMVKEAKTQAHDGKI
ncbi:MAG: tetratricopeptide repeat protein [Alphaproteobacteria bacterium]|nr:tetratricopeptide repeat protein [Alphaproteobacteria bacterium]